MKSNAILMYQVIEEKHHMTDEPNDDVTFPSEFIHRTYKRAIDELYGLGYRFKNTEQTNDFDPPIEYFFKKKRKEQSEYDTFHKAYIKTLTLMKNELKKENDNG